MKYQIACSICEASVTVNGEMGQVVECPNCSYPNEVGGNSQDRIGFHRFFEEAWRYIEEEHAIAYGLGMAVIILGIGWVPSFSMLLQYPRVSGGCPYSHSSQVPQ